jgi:hypothetical protein
MMVTRAPAAWPSWAARSAREWPPRSFSTPWARS